MCYVAILFICLGHKNKIQLKRQPRNKMFFDNVLHEDFLCHFILLINVEDLLFSFSFIFSCAKVKTKQRITVKVLQLKPVRTASAIVIEWDQDQSLNDIFAVNLWSMFNNCSFDGDQIFYIHWAQQHSIRKSLKP